jgi:Zn-dependent M28 family amino/carboxypeptidase
MIRRTRHRNTGVLVGTVLAAATLTLPTWRSASARGALSTACAAAAQVAAPIAADELISTVRILASQQFEGRRTGTPGGLRARQWVLEQFKTAGMMPAGADYLVPFQFTAKAGARVDGANIAGRCPASAPGDKVFVVSAHYDHLGTRDGRLYPGADDNASGVAVLLALARRCLGAPLRHSMLFVAFDAEEQGLEGAKAFVASPPVGRERIALNVNLDMVARGDKGELYVAGTHHSPILKAPLDAVAAAASIKLLFGHDRPELGVDDWTSQSDHAAFHDAGIPFVYFGVEDHPDYHEPTDTADRIDAMFFSRAANTIHAAIVALDRALPTR